MQSGKFQKLKSGVTQRIGNIRRFLMRGRTKSDAPEHLDKEKPQLQESRARRPVRRVAPSSERMAVFIARVNSASQWIQVHVQPISRRMNWEAIRAGGLIFGLAFVAASSVSTFAVSMVLKASAPAKKPNDEASTDETEIVTQAKVVDDSGASVSEITKKILTRNLFNSEGVLAPEAVLSSDDAKQTSTLDFEAVACNNEKLPVEVLGTIDTGSPFASYVTVKDQKVSYADTYKVGSVIIDYEDYEVYKVTRESAEFRKGDQKICVTINETAKGPKSNGASSAGPAAKAEVRPENVVNLEFTAEDLAQGIGPGYANILNSAKLIPVPVEGAGGTIAGFKLIAIKSDSLFNKLKLLNQDIVTEVNGVSLKDASEGFKLYQALQEEREINIRVMRDGTPMTFMVRVK